MEPITEDKTAELVLSKQGQSWFDEEVEMENETSFISWADALKAMREYHEEMKSAALLHFLNWYNKLTASEKVSVWSKDGQYKGIFTKDNEQLVESYFDHLRRMEKRSKQTQANENI